MAYQEGGSIGVADATATMAASPPMQKVTPARRTREIGNGRWVHRILSREAKETTASICNFCEHGQSCIRRTEFGEPIRGRCLQKPSQPEDYPFYKPFTKNPDEFEGRVVSFLTGQPET